VVGEVQQFSQQFKMVTPSPTLTRLGFVNRMWEKILHSVTHWENRCIIKLTLEHAVCSPNCSSAGERLFT